MGKYARGFTLIELMIVVAIIGLLASVAVPNLQRAQLRSRTAERATIMDAIGRAANDTVSSQQGLPTRDPAVPGSGTNWIGDFNPPGPPTPYKRLPAVGAAAPGWQFLPVIIQGAAYYSYYFIVSDPNGDGRAANTTMKVVSRGDLDGDGNVSQKTIDWGSRGYAFYRVSETPPAGEEDLTTF
jgi:type IV pilus assembly protein PilA